jgi:hypothetical protein
LGPTPHFLLVRILCGGRSVGSDCVMSSSRLLKNGLVLEALA